MDFKIIGFGNIRPGSERNIVYLRKSSWDDWFVYSTLYSISYVDNQGISHEIGSTKIGKIGLKGASTNSGRVQDRVPNPPSEFTQLDRVFFSLGQAPSFYKNLNEIGANIRAEILEGLNDIAYSEEIFSYAKNEEVTKVSLMRDVSPLSITGQFRRLAIGNSTLSSYSFKYTSKKYTNSEPYIIDFKVNPGSNPPTNVQVVIGRNGVGKTSLLNGMINSLLLKDSNSNVNYGHFDFISEENDRKTFANLISVSFSAFDDNEPISERKDKSEGLNYSYIGLKRPLKKDGTAALSPKSPWMLQTEFYNSLRGCIKMNKLDLWRRSIHILESDPIFRDSGVIDLTTMNPDEPSFEKNTRKLFERFSSGHRIVLLTITKIVEKLEERSLVLLDEPEAHLHPPLLAAFIRVMSDLLVIRNGVGIVATHSPVVLQEVPKSCVWRLSRSGAIANAERLQNETIAENVGTLTKEIFGLEITESGYHKLISKAVESEENLDDVIESFSNELGQEGLAIARTMMHIKNRNEEN